MVASNLLLLAGAALLSAPAALAADNTFASALAPGHIAALQALSAGPLQTPGPNPLDDTARNIDDDPAQARECYTSLTSVIKTLPTPGPELESFVLKHADDDLCKLTVPNSLTSAFSSYESALVSWAKTGAAEITKALDACPGYETLTSQLDVPTCSADAAAQQQGAEDKKNAGVSVREVGGVVGVVVAAMMAGVALL